MILLIGVILVIAISGLSYKVGYEDGRKQSVTKLPETGIVKTSSVKVVGITEDGWLLHDYDNEG
jgi:hypothetical protein